MERLDYRLGMGNLSWLEKVVNKLKEIVSFRWGKAVLISGIILLLLMVVTPLLIWITNVPSWPNWTGLNGKTTWDLLDLAIIPIILAIVAAWFRRIEGERAVKREELDKGLEEDRQREAALQIYLDQMKDLLLEKHLLKSELEDEVRAVARTLTLTTLKRLDGPRRGVLLRFLQEAGLIIKNPEAVISLQGADLSEAELHRANLNKADLSGSRLSRADLSQTELNEADLSRTRLRKANLSRANLSKANLDGAYLSWANLGGATLNGASLDGTYLSGVNLRWANLHGVDLSRAQLNQADLSGTRYNLETTRWPKDFDPVQAGAIPAAQVSGSIADTYSLVAVGQAETDTTPVASHPGGH